jgi:hypothetical protein
MNGYVYLLTNPYLPNICKIGKTTRSIDCRLSELYNTSIPRPYTVVLLFEVDNCHKLEHYIHRKCSYLRINRKREFFIFDDIHDVEYYKQIFIESINKFEPTVSPYFNESCL